MKSIKFLLPLLAVVLSLVAFAATSHQKAATKPAITYYFTGLPGQEFNSAQYSSEEPAGGCDGETLTCAFEVPSGYTSIADYMTWLNTQSNKQALYDAQVRAKRD